MNLLVHAHLAPERNIYRFFLNIFACACLVKLKCLFLWLSQAEMFIPCLIQAEMLIPLAEVESLFKILNESRGIVLSFDSVKRKCLFLWLTQAKMFKFLWLRQAELFIPLTKSSKNVYSIDWVKWKCLFHWMSQAEMFIPFDWVERKCLFLGLSQAEMFIPLTETSGNV